MILETRVSKYLGSLLTPTAQKSSELDQREIYKIYGLLLSACKIKDPKKVSFNMEINSMKSYVFIRMLVTRRIEKRKIF